MSLLRKRRKLEVFLKKLIFLFKDPEPRFLIGEYCKLILPEGRENSIVERTIIREMRCIDRKWYYGGPVIVIRINEHWLLVEEPMTRYHDRIPQYCLRGVPNGRMGLKTKEKERDASTLNG